MKTFRTPVFSIVLVFGQLLAQVAGVQASDDELVFTAIPDQDESRLQERFGRITRYLERELGVTVKYIPVKSYTAAVTAFRNDQVQLAWFGGLSGVRARLLVPGAQAIAQGREDREFVTYFIAHHSTGLGQLDDLGPLAGRTFTFGSKGSTSGRLMPEFHIRKEFGAAPGEVFRRVGFSGDHSRTIALVQSSAFDTGAVNFKVWESELDAGKIDLDKVSVVWQTPPYPDYHWTIRPDVDLKFGDGFADRVREALLAIQSDEILSAFPRSGFVPASNDDYLPIQRVAQEIGLLAR